jgi:hypothetical protein
MESVTMKMTVIADKSGKVISTYMHPERPGKDDPTLHISGGPGHTVHELDLPADYEKIKSAEELHSRVGEHLKKLLPKRD